MMKNADTIHKLLPFQGQQPLGNAIWQPKPFTLT